MFLGLNIGESLGGNVFFSVAIIVATGLLFSKLAKVCKFPNVTGYLVGGLLVGPSLLGLVTKESLEGISVICDIALGFIAFSIGSEFKVSYFRKVGIRPLIIALGESLIASVFVFGAMMLFGQTLEFALVISAIAAATAPAATLLVIKQYKAKGIVTDNLLCVVAIDDAVALAIFGFNMTFALSIKNGFDTGSLALSICMPFIEIIVSLVIGIILGAVLTLLLKWFTGRSNRLCCALACILLGMGIDVILNNAFGMNTSTLLTCMMIGAVVINTSNHFGELEPLVERFTPPLYIMFFVISGAELDVTAIASIGLIGVIYIISRVLGKYVGAVLGGVASKADKATIKYLGFCLIPQAGVAIGLSRVAVSLFGEEGLRIQTIILCATLVYELIGPLVVKMTLKKTGDIESTEKVHDNDKPNKPSKKLNKLTQSAK